LREPRTNTLVTAYHESGHACIARVLGHAVIVVTMDHTRTRWEDKGATSRWNEAVIALAGPAAETRYAGYSPEEIEREWKAHWWGDRANAERHLLHLPIKFAQVEAVARHLVAVHWATIQRVAQALNAQGGLAPFQLERLRDQ
jgi:hypothetical protein